MAVLAWFRPAPDGRQRLEAAADALRRHLKRAFGHEVWMGKTLAALHSFQHNRTGLNTRQIVRAIAAHLDVHYMQDTDLASLAHQYHLSVPHLSRLFKKEIGQNFSSYLTAVRLETARTLLSQTDLSVYVVSRLTGFISHGYFSSVFKRRYRMSPTDYRVSANVVGPG